MKVLVTGASGFIGKNVCLKAPRSWKIHATYRETSDFPSFVKKHDLTHVTPEPLDLESEAQIDALAKREAEFDLCIYLAANGDPALSSQRPAWDLRSNTLGLVNLLDRVRFDRFIFFSSGAVYDGLSGDVTPLTPVAPALPYAISKLAAERYVDHFWRERKIKTATLCRFFGAFGPHEPARKIYSKLVQQFGIARDPRFKVRGDGKNLIDAMFVDDAIRGIFKLAERRNAKLKTLDFYSGEPISLTSLVGRAARCFGLEAQITYEGVVPEYIQFRTVDPTMAKEFGFIPSIPLEDGLKRLYGYLSV